MDRMLWATVRLGNGVVCLKKAVRMSMTKRAAVGLASSQTNWRKSEHNNSSKTSLYNFRTVRRVSTSFKISDLRFVPEKLGYKKTLCQMGAENVNRRTQEEMPGCSSSIFVTPSNWRSVFWPYCHWRWDVDFLHKYRVKATVNATAPLIVPESKEVQASIFN